MRVAKPGGVSLELILLSSLIVILGIALYSMSCFEHDLIIQRFCLSDRFKSPAVSIKNKRIGERNGIAILAHGFQCNKSMMMQIGKYLAIQGLEVYAFDLPGHGESLKKYSPEDAYTAAQEAVSEIIESAKAEEAQVVLIGHSYGCTVLAAAARNHPEIAASIYIGPGPVEVLGTDCPRNVLIITAERDYVYIKDFAQRIFCGLTGQNKAAPGDERGEMHKGTARAWYEVPHTAHVGLLLSIDVHRLAGQWSGSALKNDISEPKPFSTAPAKVILVTILAISAVVCSLISKLIPGKMLEKGVPGEPVRTFNALGLGIISGAIVTRYYNPLGFIHLMEGNVIISFIFVSGLFGMIFLFISGRRTSIPPAAEIFSNTLVAITGFAFFYVCIVFAMESNFSQVGLASSHHGRLISFPIIALCSLPFCLLLERLLRQIQGLYRGAVTGTVFALFVGMIPYAFLNISLYFVGDKLFRFNETLLAIMAYCAFISAIFFHNRRSILSGAIFTSLVVGWMISVSFIYY